MEKNGTLASPATARASQDNDEKNSYQLGHPFLSWTIAIGIVAVAWMVRRLLSSWTLII
jgi:nicotinamide riboside transporter PnuC